MNLKLSSGQFYGVASGNYQTGEFNLTETVYAPHSNLPRHSHENPYLKFVLCGAYLEGFGGKTRESVKSMLTFHPAGEIHEQSFKQAKVKLFRVELNRKWIDKYLDEFGWFKNEPEAFQNDVLSRLAIKLYGEFRAPDNVSSLLIEGLVLELIGEMLRHGSRSSQKNFSSSVPSWLEQAREFIHARATEDLTLSLIAENACIHPGHLAREFRRYFNSTIGDYVRKLRIEIACREMINPNIQLAEIAQLCGFYDQSHFTKAFQRVMNITPALYRAQL